MSPRQSDIDDMKCWLLRLAQKRWRMPAVRVAQLFSEAGVYDYVTELYDLLHLSSYKRPPPTTSRPTLPQKGIRYASSARRSYSLPRQLRFHRMPYVRGERALWDLTKRP